MRFTKIILTLCTLALLNGCTSHPPEYPDIREYGEKPTKAIIKDNLYQHDSMFTFEFREVKKCGYRAGFRRLVYGWCVYHRYDENTATAMFQDNKLIKLGTNFVIPLSEIRAIKKTSPSTENALDSTTFNGTPQSKPVNYWVTASRLSRRTCPDSKCGKVGSLIFGEKVIGIEEKNGWVRITQYYEASCANGVSKLITQGNNKCLSSNGVETGYLAEWTSAKYLSKNAQ
ncbi:MAG: hypothetical protein JKY24_09675 [Pseudomonadales bacterium]|nr:hypothetical protein [Pseudomonadales bacterium]